MERTIKLWYDGGELIVSIPGGVTVDEFQAKIAARTVSPEQFAGELTRAGFREFLTSPPLVIVNDGYRHTPTARILSWLNDIAPLVVSRSRFLVATGAHSAPSEKHLRVIFGDLYENVKSRVYWHDALNADSMIPVGTDSFGEPVLINRLFAEAGRVIIIGSVEPHYFAGFTGGRKSIFPGICDLKTIERNHNLADSLDAQPMKLDRNPVQEHLDGLLNLVDTDKLFSIQIVLDSHDTISGICCGRIRDSFHEAVLMAEEIYSCRNDGQYDMTLAELLPPLDDNLYQAQKALENCQTSVRDGGVCVVAAACRGGIGTDSFFKLADVWDRSANQAKDGIRRFGSHKLSRVNAMARRIDVRLYSALPADQVRHVYWEPVADLNAFVRDQLGSVSRLAIVRNAGHTVMTSNGC
jgi:nickel-dependent lactate racemase